MMINKTGFIKISTTLYIINKKMPPVLTVKSVDSAGKITADLKV